VATTSTLGASDPVTAGGAGATTDGDGAGGADATTDGVAAGELGGPALLAAAGGTGGTSSLAPPHAVTTVTAASTIHSFGATRPPRQRIGSAKVIERR
jgi:hypothetical protein